MPRLFVSVDPPDDVLELIAALPRTDQPGVRWVPRDQWHVTVRFFGEAAIDDAVAALSKVSVAAADVVLGAKVSRLGRNIVCIPASGLDAIAAAVDEATATVGEPPDPRPFNGHITIARLKHRAACSVAGAPFAATFRASELHLVQSTLGKREGPRYETVFAQPLA